jgi:hypothetical protein
MYLIGDIDEPDFLVLKVTDPFHCILHSGEITLADGTTMVLVIFVVRRASSGLFDMFIVNKFFRQDGTTNHTLMSKKDVPADDVDQVASNTSSTFALGLKLKGEPDIQWDELDLREVSDREEQLQRMQGWGKVRNIKVGDPNA